MKSLMTIKNHIRKRYHRYSSCQISLTHVVHRLLIMATTLSVSLPSFSSRARALSPSSVSNSPSLQLSLSGTQIAIEYPRFSHAE